ncbi:MAG TPA: glycoside hydrolase family 76 protein [Solirubrobacteraceae bacterium]|jgi:hypothetical protein|nr:glycoside hydrolase family 76 protein [Solirubrobacteraceae bacterium]
MPRRPRLTTLLCTLLFAGLVAVPAAALARSPLRGHAHKAAASKSKSKSKSKTKTKAKPKPKPALSVDESRAISSFTAMQKVYYLPTARLYRGASGAAYSDLWPFSQGFSATVDMAALPNEHQVYRSNLEAVLGGLNEYWAYGYTPPIGYLAVVGAPKRTTGVRYFDDNEWIGLDLVRLYVQDHLAELLPQAEKIFSLVTAAWDNTTSVACPGGVPFTDLTVNGDRNTVTNAPGAELGAELYELTGDGSDLAWASKMYNWVRSCLLQPDNLYSDHINGQGQIDSTEWTYNQGSMIGAGAMLYQATKDPTYLAQAQATAQAAMTYFTGATLDTQPVVFNAIYLRNLLFLGTELPATAGDSGGNPSPTTTGPDVYAPYAQAYANDMWTNVRDPANGLFDAEPGGGTQLLDSAGMVQVYAMLSEPFSLLF